jgi:hypothetical protein
MALNSSGPISLVGCCTGVSIRKELGLSGALGMTCTAVRGLAGVACGAIVMPGSFYGKSAASYWMHSFSMPAPSSTVGNISSVTTQFNYSGFSNTQSSCVDSSGNIYYKAQTGAFRTTCANHLLKYNSSGVFQWGWDIGRTNQGNLSGIQASVVTDSSGNVYYLSLKGGNAGTSALYLTKLNSSGTKQWSVLFNMTAVLYSFPSLFVNGSVATVVANVQSGGNYLITQQFNTSDGSGTGTSGLGLSQNWQMYQTAFDGTYLYAVGKSAAYGATSVVKFPLSVGSVTWSKYFSNNTNQTVDYNAVAFDSSGNTYVAGRLIVTGAGYSRGLVQKFDTSGSLVWSYTQQITGNNSVENRFVAVDSSGNVYTLGYVFLTGYTNALSYNLLVTKRDSTGAFIWATELAPAGSGTAGSILSPSKIQVNSTYVYVTLDTSYPTHPVLVALPTNAPLTNALLVDANKVQIRLSTPSYITDSVYSNSLFSLSNNSLTTTLAGSGLNVISQTGCKAVNFTSYKVACLSTAYSSLNFSSGYGSQSFWQPGTYTFVPPAGVTSVSVVAIGAGGKGSSGGAGHGNAGGGGGLSYINNYPVSSSCSYTVTVSDPSSVCTYSRFAKGSTVLVCAGRGGNATCGCGGVGGSHSAATSTGSYGGACGGAGGAGYSGSGGGGAAGYSGRGGNGGGGYGSVGYAGSGGGAGGGSGATTSTRQTGMGGAGVGIIGQGCSGAGGKTCWSCLYPCKIAQPGSYGAYKCNSGAHYGSGFGGGGGGGSYGHCSYNNTCFPLGDQPGAGGAVRIVWPGNVRSFPSTNVMSP